MAGAHGATMAATAAITSSSVPPTTSAAPTPGRSLVLLSSLPSSFPSRRRRTNHLRQKILKTLEHKPYPDISHPEFPGKHPTIVIEETAEVHTTETDQFSFSQTTGFLDGIAGEFSKQSFAKIGLYLVGAFVIQSICAVLIFGWNDLEDEDETLNSDDSNKTKGLDSKGNPNLAETKDGGMVFFDKSEIDKKIAEIQEMAREARHQERMESKREGLVDEEDDDIDHELIDKTLKENEINSRLMKLRKSLEGKYEKLPPKFPIKEGDKGSSTTPPLMFKKKYKYKSPSIDSRDKPKGFNTTKDDQVVNGTFGNDNIIDNGVDILDNSKQTDLPNVNESMTVSEPINKVVNGSGKPNKAEIIYGALKEARKPKGFGKESESDSAMSIKKDDVNSNGSLKGKKSGNRKSAKNLGDVKSSTPTEFWWTSLPYVLAVRMQRGDDDDEESAGLFTIRNISQSKSGLLSHTVAFEDRGDATNFSYLLESFFEELDDFITHVIPIPTNELEEEVKSKRVKVVVVKKGQLKLYAGQPLRDVERALRTLIQQTDNL